MKFLEHLTTAWHETARQISYHHADDTAGEWHLADKLKPLLIELETQIKRLGGERPDGKNWLLGPGFRIQWDEAA